MLAHRHRTKFAKIGIVAPELSCGSLKLSRRDADDPLEVKGKLVLVREADAERDLHQAELAICPQELLRSFNAARDHILVRGQ